MVLRVRRAWVAVVPALALMTGGAGAATVQRVNEHVDLKLVKRDGTTKFKHTGRATGTLDGTVRSSITLKHSIALKGTVTITTSSGKLKVKVDGRARSLTLRTRFTGDASIIGGTGRYAHAKGTGTFTGVVNRRTWHATIEAKGTLRY